MQSASIQSPPYSRRRKKRIQSDLWAMHLFVKSSPLSFVHSLSKDSGLSSTAPGLCRTIVSRHRSRRGKEGPSQYDQMFEEGSFRKGYSERGPMPRSMVAFVVVLRERSFIIARLSPIVFIALRYCNTKACWCGWLIFLEMPNF